MSALTHDTAAVSSPSRLGTGLALALVSAASFGMSGALARGLLDTGWSAGAIVVLRIGIAGLVLLPFAIVALRGRWSVLRRNARLVLLYGLLAVAGTQFCFFSAVQYMQVGPALLIEFTSPAAVVAWMWLRHAQRPGILTLLGAGLAVAGLILVLDLLSGADLSLTGVLWSLGAMVGCAAYFIINGDDSTGLPPIVLATGGLVVGAVAMALLGGVGLLAMDSARADVTYAGTAYTWWQPLLALAVFTAALAYAAGVAAGRMLGSRLASFVALTEVLAGVLWAWLLLDELPGQAQLVGGLLILAGVVAVRAGEGRVVRDGERRASLHPAAT